MRPAPRHAAPRPRRRLRALLPTTAVVVAALTLQGGSVADPQVSATSAAAASTAVPTAEPLTPSLSQTAAETAAATLRALDRRTGRVSRNAARTPVQPSEPEWLQECPEPAKRTSFANGQLPGDALCALPRGGHLLRSDAAHAFWKLNRAYRARFGKAICVTDSYRSLDQQYAVAAMKPGLAAAPGTSNHGWGVALDLCGGAESFGSPQHAWLREKGARFGWVLPQWAREDGSLPEPWHWEFRRR